MKKIQDKCEYCGRKFGFFTKKYTATKHDGKVYVTFFLCDTCFKHYSALPKK